ncbi:MAG: MvaI/BcnI family restriction endonuclease [Candidatus Gastranaerophilales bacterium]|nr:MvaI/BcnI family restriction endonuclease [Candidatus Gastranaerophilales bacterium]
MKTYTKDSLIASLKEIREQDWIESGRQGNCGGIGNTLEDLLGIEENNLPIPNAAEWELKTQRKNTSSLVTLFHTEPSPRACKFVPTLLLLKYGWLHDQAGNKYPQNEMSFRQTIHGKSRSDRGFKVIVNREDRKVLISFDANVVDPRHANWLESVKERVGLDELSPQPYWGFDDLFHKAGTKLHNCFFVIADCKKEKGKEFFLYEKFFILRGFSLEKFLTGIEEGCVMVDFDARTGHNHGTKFRLKSNYLVNLYDNIIEF